MPISYWTRNNTDIQYYDYLLGRYNSVDLNMLFLIGYSAGLRHSHVSDHIWIPDTMLDSEGNEMIIDKSMFRKAHQYLDDKWRIDLIPDGLVFDIWALRFILDDLGFSSGKAGRIPMFMRSSDFDPVDLKDIVSFTPPERLPDETDSEYALRTERAYVEWVAMQGNVNYTARYQLAEGLLYGLSNSGYGTLPWTRTDAGWFQGEERFRDVIQSAIDTLRNPVYRGHEEKQGHNLFYNWDNGDPVPTLGTVGSVSSSTDTGSVGYGGGLFGEFEVSDLPDMYRHAYIQIGSGIDVQITFFMYTARMIPNIYVSTTVESEAEWDTLYAGDYRVNTQVDFRRMPVSVHVGGGIVSGDGPKVKFPFRVIVDPYEQYVLPDMYLTADLGKVYTEDSGQGTDKDGAFILAESSIMVGSEDMTDMVAVPSQEPDFNYLANTRFRESGLTQDGHRVMYGLYASGIREIMYVRVVPDASFTHEQIERLSKAEIDEMHFNSIVGDIIETTNDYDSDRPNIVIRVGFHLTEYTGMFHIASLVIYAQALNGDVIPFSVMSLGDDQVISIDTTQVHDIELTLKINDI